MTIYYWRKLFWAAVNPVCYERQPFVNHVVFCLRNYPVLTHLATYNELHILVLAWYITLAENIDEVDRHGSVNSLMEIFENTIYRTDDFAEAIDVLMSKLWLTHTFLDKELYLKADLTKLESDRLFTPNPWHNLFQTGVYKPGINYN